MKKSIMIILMACIFIFSSCTASADLKETTSPTETQNQSVEDETMAAISDTAPKLLQTMIDTQLMFSLNLLKELNQEDCNLFFSSMSINSALSMVYFGAEGVTKDEIHNVLEYRDMTIEEVASSQKAIIESYKNTGDTTFSNANSIWIDNNFNVKDNYIDLVLEIFETEIKNIDLQKDSAVDELNFWIKKVTDNMIDKLFEKEENPLSQADMVLMNAIYFNGRWTIPFSPELTYKSNFNGIKTVSEADMMSSKENVLGYDGEDYKAVKLLYGEDERFAMVLVLPNDDINSFIQNQSIQSYSKIITEFELKEHVSIQIPKFTLEETLDLNDILKSLGMPAAFSSKADFGKMTDTEIFIGKAIHKAKIKVDEEGTEAAAATALIMLRGMPSYSFEFIADRPFLFFITDTQNEMILFTGKVCDLS